MKRIVLLSVVLLLLVIPCVVSADTLVVFPSNGYLKRGSGMDEVYSSIRNGASAYVSGESGIVQILAQTTTNHYDSLTRAYFVVDTSSLPDDCTITSAEIDVYGNGKDTGLGSPSYAITKFTPANLAAPAQSDYNKFGSDLFSNQINIADWTNDWHNFTFTSLGLSNISKTGYSDFYLRDSWDIGNSFGGTWVNSAVTKIEYNTVGDSKLVMYIVYSTSSPAPVASFTADHTSVCQQDPIQFTDQSSNTPTGWYWDFGDTTTNTTQNPIYRYSTNGLFTVKLQATNAFGFDWENKTDYIGVGDWGSCVDEGETCIA